LTRCDVLRKPDVIVLDAPYPKMTSSGHAHFRFPVKRGLNLVLNLDFLGNGLQMLDFSYAVI